MKSNYSNYCIITIPATLCHNSTTTKHLVNEVTKIAGGLSVTESYGMWIDDEGVMHTDENFQHKWNFQLKHGEAVVQAARVLINDVLAAGEKSVMVEFYVNGEYLASMIEEQEDA